MMPMPEEVHMCHGGRKHAAVRLLVFVFIALRPKIPPFFFLKGGNPFNPFSAAGKH